VVAAERVCRPLSNLRVLVVEQEIERDARRLAVYVMIEEPKAVAPDSPVGMAEATPNRRESRVAEAYESSKRLAVTGLHESRQRGLDLERVGDHEPSLLSSGETCTPRATVPE
jgi:hypothetical protein